jgi:hypothetical protein
MGATRREFVKGIAGAAVAGGLICANRKSVWADEGPRSGENLVATCGLYCGACPIYLDTQSKSDQKTREFMQQLGSTETSVKREDFLCDGCQGKGQLISFCAKCTIRSCAQGKAIARCADCPEFPCARITDFNNNHGKLLHHSEVLANLGSLRQMGIKNWAKSEEQRWRCPQCRNQLSWYDKACSKCGAARSDRLFRLQES